VWYDGALPRAGFLVFLCVFLCAGMWVECNGRGWNGLERVVGWYGISSENEVSG